MSEKDYKKEYEKLKKENTRLTVALSEKESEISLLKADLWRIKKSLFWKMLLPFRVVFTKAGKLIKRLKRIGSLRALLIKLKQRLGDLSARKDYGTKSFPDEETRAKEAGEKFPEDIKISILVPLYNTPLNFLKDMVNSVLWQTCGNWELCLADGSDKDHEYVGKYCIEEAKRDKRIIYKKLEKNERISGNTNQCLKLATGNYIGLLDHDDILHPSIIYEYMKVITERNADYIYCDEGTFHGKSINNFITLHFKPDYAIDNLRANNYICHFSVFKKTLIPDGEVFRSKYDGSQDHDMILRLTHNAENIVHVPKLLYYWRSHKASVASDISAKPYAIEAAKGAVSESLERDGFKNFKVLSTRAFETIFRIKYDIDEEPLISILIPNHNHKDDLQRCINSILEKSTYDNFEIIVIENNSTEKEIFDYYEALKADSKIKIVTYEGAFNYSKVNNYGESFAMGEYLLLLNNDTEVITLNWLEEMLMFAARKDVGCVGAKLYYPDNTIQHAGIVLGLGAHRSAGHIFYKYEAKEIGYMGKLWYEQDVSAVTGACLMVKKSLYDEVNGLDEDFEISLNDVDFCLRLLYKGYLNIFNPYCELYHYESASRGSDVNSEDKAKAERYQRECDLFKERHKEILEKGDPYYNKNFTLDRADYTLKKH